jgi:hypothetical protein
VRQYSRNAIRVSSRPQFWSVDFGIRDDLNAWRS